jgi:hypothetical protein
MPNVKGSIKARAIENVSPGIDPKKSPTTVPTAVATTVLSWSATASA